ncbi:MAG: indole-3-glycerol-phosphate synthase, partial [Cryomorphaceae bacterium]|nr:indole-3-glycerol-phosphate synthase [Cryomorphaceae bacterium]
DIVNVRDIIDIPILKKEFIISEYQIFQAKSLGSDAILLIASILTKEEILNFSSLAKSLGLEVLLEVHSGIELNKISGNNIDIIGVNNRNLDTLEIDINNSIELYSMIPDGFVKISESGISEVESILKLKEVGFDGFLIGENFMKTNDPEESAYNFIKQVENEI